MDSSVNQSDEVKTRIFIEWKKKYAEAVVDHFKPKGDVLEIGFENAFASDKILSYNPKSYTIIVFDLERQEAASRWAEGRPQVKVIKKDWRAALPELGKFDLILYSDFPPERDVEILSLLFPDDFAKLSHEAHEVTSQIKEEISQTTVQFSDQEIEEFYDRIGQYNKAKLFRFFQSLRVNGNITASQYDHVIHKHHLESYCDTINNPIDEVTACLLECVVGHLNKGGWFTIFLRNQTSRFDDPVFFEKVISNINVDYKEELVTIRLSDGLRRGLIVSVEACQ